MDAKHARKGDTLASLSGKRWSVVGYSERPNHTTRWDLESERGASRSAYGREIDLYELLPKPTDSEDDRG